MSRKQQKARNNWKHKPDGISLDDKNAKFAAEKLEFAERSGPVTSRQASEEEVNAWAVKEMQKIRDAKVAKLKAALK